MKKETEKFNRQSIINELVKSHHGDLKNYVPTGVNAAKNDPEFLAHLICWNLIKGEIRDSKIALPIINLRGLSKSDKEFAENSISCLLALDPRSLVKAYRFNKELSSSGMTIPGGHRRLFETGLKEYLKFRESNRGFWNRTAVQHKKSLKELYAVSHHKPAIFAQEILFDKIIPKNSIFEKIASLKHMSPLEAAGTIINNKIPFQIGMGALGRKTEEFKKSPELLLALMESMSGQQLISNTKMLTALGVTTQMLKSEFRKAAEKAKKDKKVGTMKANKAIEQMKEDPNADLEIIESLSNLQEAKISQRTIEGDWLILGDCSGSMATAIELAKQISSYITKSVAGKVYLVFFNTSPRLFDVTGKKLEEIKEMTRYIKSDGGTACGCGIRLLQDKNITVNGIVLVSDGGDNANPLFHHAYLDYQKKFGIEPSVYFFRVQGETNRVSGNCNLSNIHVDMTDMSQKVDYYSLPNIISTMKTSRYGLVDEIMETPLLTFNNIFKVNPLTEKRI